jgi:hypothetical protein
MPQEFEADFMPVPVSRTGKRVTLIGGVCADEGCMRPLLVIAWHTVDTNLRPFGISKTNCKTRHQTSEFVDQEIFEDWTVKMSLPEVVERCQEAHYEGSAVLILDGCTARDGDTFWDLCMENTITPYFFLPHASNQAEPCICAFVHQKA